MFSIFRSKPSYQRVRQPDSPSLDTSSPDHEAGNYPLPQPARGRSTLMFSIWTGSVIVSFLLGCIVGIDHLGATQCLESDLAWGPAGSLTRRHTHRFDGSSNATNAFKGPPSDELDAAWNRFTESKWIDGTAVVLAVSEREMADSGNANSPETVADLGKQNGGGAMGTLEMFHQLHCLNLLRKWTHVDYYGTRDHAWTSDRPASLRDHTDHCIDILRQVLMCNGDMGLVMFHWVRDVGPAPYPDFSTVHQCRDPVAILETAEAHAAPVAKPVTKTAVAHELPTFP